MSLGEKILNCRLYKARRIVANVFGILASRFREFEKPISAKNADLVILACCTLHNYFRTTSRPTYLLSASVDDEDHKQATLVLDHGNAHGMSDIISGIDSNNFTNKPEFRDLYADTS